MRQCLTYPAVMLALFVGHGARGQDIDNGRRISERSCAACHRIDMSAGKAGRAIAFSAIAGKPGVSADIVTSFLLMPHVTMPGLPLSQNDARDIAAVVMSQQKQASAFFRFVSLQPGSKPARRPGSRPARTRGSQTDRAD